MDQLEQNLDEATEAYVRLGEALGIEPEGEQIERLKQRIESLQEENEELRQQSTVMDSESLEYQEFVENDAVQAQIKVAKQEATSPRYVKGVIASILHTGGPVTYDDIADELDISTTSHVATAVNALNDRGVVTKSKRGRQTVVDLNKGNLPEIRQAALRREKTKELMSDF
ncbi:hypothetical protein ACFQH6_03540 [Halobacteriaceae archaeon GCM10025711]